MLRGLVHETRPRRNNDVTSIPTSHVADGDAPSRRRRSAPDATALGGGASGASAAGGRSASGSVRRCDARTPPVRRSRIHVRSGRARPRARSRPRAARRAPGRERGTPASAPATASSATTVVSRSGPLAVNANTVPSAATTSRTLPGPSHRAQRRRRRGRGVHGAHAGGRRDDPAAVGPHVRVGRRERRAFGVRARLHRHRRRRPRAPSRSTCSTSVRPAEVAKRRV